MTADEDWVADEYERPNKSLLKREAEDMKRLGDELVRMAPADLAQIPLPENLRDAIELARRISAHGGAARQRQLIGKLLRKNDVTEIRAALEAKALDERLKSSVRRSPSTRMSTAMTAPYWASTVMTFCTRASRQLTVKPWARTKQTGPDRGTYRAAMLSPRNSPDCFWRSRAFVSCSGVMTRSVTSRSPSFFNSLLFNLMLIAMAP